MTVPAKADAAGRSPSPWAANIAREVADLARGGEWVDPDTYGRIYGYSRDQASHILRQAFRDGALERQKAARTFAYRPISPDSGWGLGGANAEAER